MSLELKDLRCKITPLAWCWLEAEHRATGKDLAEVARIVLHEWAAQRQLACIEAQKLTAAEGISGNPGEGGPK